MLSSSHVYSKTKLGALCRFEWVNRDAIVRRCSSFYLMLPSKMTSKDRRFHLTRIRSVDAAEPENITDQKGESL